MNSRRMNGNRASIGTLACVQPRNAQVSRWGNPREATCPGLERLAKRHDCGGDLKKRVALARNTAGPFLENVHQLESQPGREWEEKRRLNIEKMNEEMEKIADDGQGEKNPGRNFLDDYRRSGPVPDADRKEGSRRHVRNWGGVDFERVKTGGPEWDKEWQGRRAGGPKGPVDMTMSMTGRERSEYERWKQEREQIDQDRLARHRNATGQWRREWDAQKTESM
ncbi:Coiled-coil domain-containing protein 9 [Acipenser ruthenus]|uniref:Coiled-coil domain-containing protein 9 n=1 Tax=Acipenser ruthenus TaxID=7906 RepID=A0A662YSA6_ACIRT|nr:Coiled-coil domain-containing protein 9 [Acipenser ruthenus]